MVTECIPNKKMCTKKGEIELHKQNFAKLVSDFLFLFVQFCNILWWDGEYRNIESFRDFDTKCDA